MAAKPYRSYLEQVELLRGRGMDVGSDVEAVSWLRRANYYRLSGYWYPFRQRSSLGRSERFVAGTRLADVWALHEFDTSLRAVTFSALGRVEGFLRARLAHELGKIDPCVHLRPDLLGPEARGSRGVADYQRWLGKYERAVRESREDFVDHHKRTKGGVLPVWVAVEVLDWGSLTRLYGFAPRSAQDAVADDFGLNGPQLASWMKSLNIVRNICAHHGRLFNRVHAIKPKMPPEGRIPALDEVRRRIEIVGPGRPLGAEYSEHWFGERTFGQLTMAQHLLRSAQLGGRSDLPAAVADFPEIAAMPVAALGAPADWQSLTLWRP